MSKCVRILAVLRSVHGEERSFALENQFNLLVPTALNDIERTSLPFLYRTTRTSKKKRTNKTKCKTAKTEEKKRLFF